MLIQISGHYGDPKADKLFWSIQKKLNELFEKNISGTYFKTIVKFSIVFLVSGKVRDFGSKEAQKMKHLKKDGEITIDLVFPQNSWYGVEQNKIKQHVSNEVKKCLDLMVKKVQEIEQIEDAQRFKDDVKRVILEFLENQ